MNRRQKIEIQASLQLFVHAGSIGCHTGAAEMWELVAAELVMCGLGPEAASRAEPSPFRLGQARPNSGLQWAYGLAPSF